MMSISISIVWAHYTKANDATHLCNVDTFATLETKREREWEWRVSAPLAQWGIDRSNWIITIPFNVLFDSNANTCISIIYYGHIDFGILENEWRLCVHDIERTCNVLPCRYAISNILCKRDFVHWKINHCWLFCTH